MPLPWSGTNKNLRGHMFRQTVLAGAISGWMLYCTNSSMAHDAEWSMPGAHGIACGNFDDVRPLADQQRALHTA
jgi:hypothetical protein